MFRKENLVLTYVSGEQLFKDKAFWIYVNSLSNISNADFVILTQDISESIEDRLAEKEILVVRVETNAPFLFRDRYLSFWEYLNEHGYKYKHVLVSECSDTIFQANPFDWIKEWRSRYDNIKGSHGFLDHFIVLMAESFQNNLTCVKHFDFQKDISELCLKENRNRWVDDKIFLGTSRAMQDWYFLVWMATIKTIGQTDQETINWLMYYLENDDTYQISFPQHDSLCLTGIGVKEGMIEPILKDGILFSPQNKPYYIVHQWNKLNKEIVEKITEKYV